jgi:protein TonB
MGVRRPRPWLVPAGGLALLLNFVLFASAARLTRERLFEVDITEPVSVTLVTIKPQAPPPEPERREIPKPKPKPQPDFAPELARPSVAAPDPLAINVQIDPALFAGGPARGDLVFNAGDLDTPPAAVVRSIPVYPYKALQRNIEGTVEVKFLVGADGRISDIQILDSQPAGLFDAAVREAVPQWTFRPGVLEGQAVSSWVVTTVEFKLDSRSR